MLHLRVDGLTGPEIVDALQFGLLAHCQQLRIIFVDTAAIFDLGDFYVFGALHCDCFNGG